MLLGMNEKAKTLEGTRKPNPKEETRDQTLLLFKRQRKSEPDDRQTYLLLLNYISVFICKMLDSFEQAQSFEQEWRFIPCFLFGIGFLLKSASTLYFLWL